MISIYVATPTPNIQFSYGFYHMQCLLVIVITPGSFLTICDRSKQHWQTTCYPVRIRLNNEL